MDLGKTQARLLGFGAITVAGAVIPAAAHLGLEASSLLPLLLALGSAASGVAQNLVATAIEQKIREPYAKGIPLVRNHDLTIIIGKAIASAIHAFAAAQPGKSQKTLRKLSSRAEGLWLEAASWNHPSLLPLQEQSLPNYFIGSLKDILTAKPLGQNQWKQLIQWMAVDSKLDVGPSVVTSLAHHLTNSFSQHLFETIKEDASRTGKAFAALQVSLLSQIRGDLDSLGRHGRKHRISAVRSRKLLKDLHAKLSAIGDTVAGDAFELHRVSGDLAQLRKDVARRFPQPSASDQYPGRGQSRALSAPEVHILSALPTLDSRLVGRKNTIRRLSRYAKRSTPTRVHLVVLKGVAGAGKSAIAAELLAQLIAERRKERRRIVVYSFYRQGATGELASADVFIAQTLERLGAQKPYPAPGRDRATLLAAALESDNTVLFLDGIEATQEGLGEKARIKDAELRELLKQLAVKDNCVCFITSRNPIAELTSYQGHTLEYIDVEGLLPSEGLELLRNLGVKGSNKQLREAAIAASGHCLTLQLLGRLVRAEGECLNDEYVRRTLGRGFGRGSNAKRLEAVMAAYESRLSSYSIQFLRLASIFDRRISAVDIAELIQATPIPGVTDGLYRLSGIELRVLVADLRDLGLILAEDPFEPGSIDLHPMVRAYVSNKLETTMLSSWEMANRTIGELFADRAPPLPASAVEMETLFRSVIHLCSAGEHSRALHGIYSPRIMRGTEEYAANVLGCLSSTVTVLSAFFDDRRWSSPSGRLSAQDQVMVLLEAGRFLTESRGYANSSAGIAYAKAEELSKRDLSSTEYFDALLGLTRFFRLRGLLKKSRRWCEKLMRRAITTQEPIHLAAAYRAFAANDFYEGRFETCYKDAVSGENQPVTGAEAWEGAHHDVNEPVVSCKGYRALALWFLGDEAAASVVADEAYGSALALKHGHSIAIVALIRCMVAHLRGDFEAVRSAANDMLSIAVEKGFTVWTLAAELFVVAADVRRGDRSKNALDEMESRIKEWMNCEAELFVPYWFGILAEAALTGHYFARAERAVEKGLRSAANRGEHWWDVELLRLRAAARLESNRRGAIADAREALDVAKHQSSPTLERRVRIFCDNEGILL
jgi:hypothetical protein